MDPAARQSILADELGVLEDMGVPVDLPLFQQASQEAQLAADKTREQATPGFIESLGRQAFQDGKKFEEHGYPENAVAEIDKWQRGFLAGQKAKEEADWKKAEDAKAAKAAAKAAKANGDDAKASAEA